MQIMPVADSPLHGRQARRRRRGNLESDLKNKGIKFKLFIFKFCFARSARHIRTGRLPVGRARGQGTVVEVKLSLLPRAVFTDSSAAATVLLLVVTVVRSWCWADQFGRLPLCYYATGLQESGPHDGYACNMRGILRARGVRFHIASRS